MESTPDHRWLMQYNIVNLVNQCRRLIRAEFDENLSLTDPQLRFKLAHSPATPALRAPTAVRNSACTTGAEDPPRLHPPATSATLPGQAMASRNLKTNAHTLALDTKGR